MKLILSIPLALFFWSCQNTSVSSKNPQALQPIDSVFDSLLAKKLGADEYGMSSYVMAFLKSGPDRTQDSVESARLQRAHLDNMKILAAQGKLVLAGPFLDDGEIRGIYIFNVSDMEEARQLTETDPSVQAGRLSMELKPWYGSAALKMVNKLHKEIQKVEF